MHTMPQECIVVVFWSPHCPHCQQAIPLLYEKYEKELKALGVGVYAVADARDSSLFYDWRAFIRTNHLDWVNVGVPWHVYRDWGRSPGTVVPAHTTAESINYAETWEANSTPQYYVLDKERRILAKPASLNEVMDAVHAYRGGH